MKNTFTENQFESCVMCSKVTNIPISQPIENRVNYVMGVGQLCDECIKKLENEE